MYMYQANKRVLWVRTVPGQTQGTADTGPPVPWEIQGTRVTGPPVPCQNPGPTGSGSGRTRSHTLEKRSNLPVRTTLPRRLRPCRTLSTAAISRPATALGLALGGGLLLYHARISAAPSCLQRHKVVSTFLGALWPNSNRASGKVKTTGPPGSYGSLSSPGNRRYESSGSLPKPGSNGFRYRSDLFLFVGLGASA